MLKKKAKYAPKTKLIMKKKEKRETINIK